VPDYRDTDDQYQTDEQPAAVQVAVSGLASAGYELTHYRIDRQHSNAHTVWKDLGSPQDPTVEQLSAIHARQGLEPLEDARTVAPSSGNLTIDVRLPLEAVSLLILTPAH
jgi:xylan 1,4-beta-xylosidase